MGKEWRKVSRQYLEYQKWILGYIWRSCWLVIKVTFWKSGGFWFWLSFGFIWEGVGYSNPHVGKWHHHTIVDLGIAEIRVNYQCSLQPGWRWARLLGAEMLLTRVPSLPVPWGFQHPTKNVRICFDVFSSRLPSSRVSDLNKEYVYVNGEVKWRQTC